MKNSFDTNVLLYAPFSRSCAVLVNEKVEDLHRVIISYVVYEEAEPKLNKLFSMLSALRSECKDSSDFRELLRSERYAPLRSIFPQHHSLLHALADQGYFDEEEVDRFLEYLLVEIRKVLKLLQVEDCLYPADADTAKERLKSARVINVREKLQNTVTDSDSKIVGLLHDFCLRYESRVNVFSTDRSDLVENKRKIQRISPSVIVQEVSDFDPEDLQVRDFV